jgi:hypothetical protein
LEISFPALQEPDDLRQSHRLASSYAGRIFTMMATLYFISQSTVGQASSLSPFRCSTQISMGTLVESYESQNQTG